MKFDIYIKVEGKDKYGKIDYFDEHKANSAVLAFIDILAVQMGQTSISIPDTGNTGRSVNQYAGNISVGSAAGDVNYGIRVGTGTNAVTIADYALQTAIAHGGGAGQLSHGACAVGAPGTTGTTRQFTVSRTFTNLTASPITVNEVGLICRALSTPYYFIIDRTLNTFTVTAGGNKTVTYTIKVTV